MRALVESVDAFAGALLARLGRSSALAVVAIAIVAGLLLIPGQARVPVTDRDEARYVLASQQMLETGDFIEPRNLDEPRWKKPVGIYWLQSAAAAASGMGADAPVWVFRLPSALGILAAALLTLWAMRPLVGPGPAAVAGLAVAGAVVTAFEGHIAKTDAALLAVIVLAQGALVRALDRVPELGFGWPHALFWTALSAGILIKGPIVLIVAGGTLLWLTVFELSTDALRRTKPWPGLLLLAILTAPWFLAIGLRTDWAFYAVSVGGDLLGKVDGAAEGHVGPPGYYLMTIWVTFWPWTPLALLALPLAWSHRRSEAVRFLAGWIIPTWAVFAVATTKLPHYVMPVLPAVGALAGMLLFAGREAVRPLLSRVAAVAFLAGALVLAGLAIGAPLWFEGQVFWIAAALAALGLVVSALAAAALWFEAPRGAALLGVIAAAILVPALLRDTIPRLDSLFLSPKIAALDARLDACVPRPVVATGYEELSVAVLAGTDTVLDTPARAAEVLRSGEPGWRVFATAGPAADELASRAGTPLIRIATIDGINYNLSPDPVEIGVFARADDPSLDTCAKD